MSNLFHLYFAEIFITPPLLFVEVIQGDTKKIVKALPWTENKLFQLRDSISGF